MGEDNQYNLKDTRQSYLCFEEIHQLTKKKGCPQMN